MLYCTSFFLSISSYLIQLLSAKFTEIAKKFTSTPIRFAFWKLGLQSTGNTWQNLLHDLHLNRVNSGGSYRSSAEKTEGPYNLKDIFKYKINKINEMIVSLVAG